MGRDRVIGKEDAAGIARPYAIGAPAMKDDVAGERVCLLQNCLRAILCAFAVDDQIDALVASQVADDLGIDPRNRLELSRPVAAQVRPS